MSKPSTPNVPYLDGWRGLAILGVLIGHFFLRPRFSWMGNFGVQLFFALSGYLMAHLLFIKRVGMADFFARRLSRVVPTFVLFVAAMYLYAATLQSVPYAVPVQELLATLAFARTYFPADSSIWTTPWQIGHLWSLNVEEHSYIFLAIGAVLTRGAKSKTAANIFLLGSVAVVIMFCLYYSAVPPSGASPWFVRSECAALALIAAAAIRIFRHSASHPLIKTVSPLLPLLWIVIGAVCISVFKRWGGQYIIAPLCLALAINYLDCVPGLLKDALSNRVLTWFGKCSFSLYLWQQPFFVMVLNKEISAWQGFALGIAVGSVSFYVIENPLRLRLNSAWAARKARAAQTANAAI
jgi:peptidoglycan/LPS O-acetylase OafA/YrhL